MEPIRFADILFVFITLVITFTILWFVNKAKIKSRKTAEDSQFESTDDAVVSDRNEN